MNDLFDALVSFLFSLSRNPCAVSRHLWGSAARFFFFFTSESKIVEEVKIKPGRSFKRYFKQKENALLFCKRFKMLTFSQFSPDIFFFFKTPRHLTSSAVVQFVLPHIFGVKWFIVLRIYPPKEGQWSLAIMVTPDLCRRQCLLDVL